MGSCSTPYVEPVVEWVTAFHSLNYFFYFPSPNKTPILARYGLACLCGGINLSPRHATILP